MYEGCKKDDKRHSLVNKQCIAGIMKPKEIKELRDARVFEQYDVDSIKLRVTNADGAKWTKGITAKGGIYQKDQFHIMQEIVRDVPKEYQNIIKELVNTKQYEKIQGAIEGLRYELGGEYEAIKKLNKLQSYLSSGLERYQDLVEIPEAPEGIEYRNMGTQESQIFSKLKKRFCSGRKAFGEHGENALAKVCVLSEEFRLEDIETPIPIDTSVEDWIKEIEENVKRNISLKDKFLTTEIPPKESIGFIKGTLKNIKVLKQLTMKDYKKDKKIAEKRTNKIIESISKLHNLTNTSFYEYTNEQIEAIFDAIQRELDNQRNVFEDDKKKRDLNYFIC